jgi:hypothetical protein
MSYPVHELKTKCIDQSVEYVTNGFLDFILLSKKNLQISSTIPVLPIE